MNDFLSFFRFMLPGIVYWILLVISIYFYDGDCLIKFLNSSDYEHLTKNIYSLIGLFIISGGIGYLFSIIYRLAFPVHGLNHVNTITNLCENGDITILESNNKPFEKIKNENEKQIKAYEIVNVIWHMNHKFFDNSKTEFQATILNSLGATMIACLFSIISFLFFAIKIHPTNQICTDILPSLLIISAALFIIQYQFEKSSKMYERWINSTLASTILANKSKSRNENISTERTPNKSDENNKFISTIKFID